MDFKISYGITVSNEHKELDRLLSFLHANKREVDEIVVQGDTETATQEVESIAKNHGATYISHPLNRNFAQFKNNLTKNCINDYIFQIDADEVPAEETVKNLHLILGANLDADLFLVPRVNTVDGLTEHHIKKWNWNVNQSGWVNWPDYQYRIYKNRFFIKWGFNCSRNICAYSISF